MGSMGKDLQNRLKKSLRIISVTFMKGEKEILNEMQFIFKVNLLQFCNTSSLCLLLKERFCPTKIEKKEEKKLHYKSKQIVLNLKRYYRNIYYGQQTISC